MNYGLGTCSVCHCTYQKHSHNSLVCGEDCRVEKKRRQDAEKWALKATPATCPICGGPPKEYRKRIYVTCGSTACRLAMRKKWYDTHTRPERRNTVVDGVERSCLKCQKPFVAPNRFIRLCGDCKSSFAANTTGHGWWGKSI